MANYVLAHPNGMCAADRFGMNESTLDGMGRDYYHHDQTMRSEGGHQVGSSCYPIDEDVRYNHSKNVMTAGGVPGHSI
jgi:hypothetical protein